MWRQIERGGGDSTRQNRQWECIRILENVSNLFKGNLVLLKNCVAGGHGGRRGRGWMMEGN